MDEQAGMEAQPLEVSEPISAIEHALQLVMGQEAPSEPAPEPEFDESLALARLQGFSEQEITELGPAAVKAILAREERLRAQPSQPAQPSPEPAAPPPAEAPPSAPPAGELDVSSIRETHGDELADLLVKIKTEYAEKLAAQEKLIQAAHQSLQHLAFASQFDARLDAEPENLFGRTYRESAEQKELRQNVAREVFQISQKLGKPVLPLDPDVMRIAIHRAAGDKLKASAKTEAAKRAAPSRMPMASRTSGVTAHDPLAIANRIVSA